MLGAVEWGIYPYISMSMLLLFTRIRRANVGSHAIVFKSLSFAPFSLKHNPQSVYTKTGSAAFFKSLSIAPFSLKHNPQSVYTKTGSAAFSKVSVFDRRNRSKSYVLKLKRASVNRT